jgi:ATP-dependent exoDNAse (exonuclease V) beta subunit
MFTHRSAPTLPELTSQTIDGKRFYTTPEGKVYPSITTVLSVLNKEAIEEWRERIGQEEAQKISEHAANRGTDLHAVLESYIKNEPLTFPPDPRSKVKIMFDRLKRVLTKVDNVLAQEIPLYSDQLAVAGRCDCIAEWDGTLSILDFKGATKAKKKEWITSYFLQTAAYSIMFEERTGIRAEQLVILMSGENDFSCQVFVEKREKWIRKLEETIALFTSENMV